MLVIEGAIFGTHWLNGVLLRQLTNQHCLLTMERHMSHIFQHLPVALRKVPMESLFIEHSTLNDYIRDYVAAQKSLLVKRHQPPQLVHTTEAWTMTPLPLQHDQKHQVDIDTKDQCTMHLPDEKSVAVQHCVDVKDMGSQTDQLRDQCSDQLRDHAMAVALEEEALKASLSDGREMPKEIAREMATEVEVDKRIVKEPTTQSATITVPPTPIKGRTTRLSLEVQVPSKRRFETQETQKSQNSQESQKSQEVKPSYGRRMRTRSRK